MLSAVNNFFPALDKAVDSRGCRPWFRIALKSLVMETLEQGNSY